MCQEARSAHRYLAVTKETLRLLVSKIVKYAATVVWEIHGCNKENTCKHAKDKKEQHMSKDTGPSVINVSVVIKPSQILYLNIKKKNQRKKTNGN